MKRLLSGFLSLSIAFSSFPAIARNSQPIQSSAWTGIQEPTPDDVRVVSFDLPANEKHVAGKVVMTFVPRAKSAILLQFSKMWNAITFSAGKNDALASQLDDKTQNIVYADQPEKVPLLQRAKQSLANYMKRRAKFMEEHSTAIGIAIAFIPAIGYGTYYTVATNDYMAGAKAFGLGYMFALGIGLFSKQWLSFSHDKIGGSMAGVVSYFASKLGTSVSEMTRERIIRSGQVLAAYGMNWVGAAGLMAIGGLMQDPNAFNLIFLNALYANHDVVDFKHQLHFGDRVAELLAPWRILAFVPLEVLSLMGYHDIELSMGALVVATSLSIIFKEEFGMGWENAKEFARIDAQAASDTYRLARDNFRRLTGYFKNVTTAKISVEHEINCEIELSTPSAIATAQ